MKRHLFTSLVIALACLTVNAQDSLTPSKRFAFGLNAGQFKRILNAEIGTETVPYYMLSGENKGFGISAGAFVRWYLSGNVFLHAGGGVSYRNQFMYDSVPSDPYFFTDGIVGKTYSGYRVATVNYHSSNYDVNASVGYETTLQRLKIRTTAGLGFTRYMRQVYDFDNYSFGKEHHDTVATGGQCDRYVTYSNRNFWHGTKAWALNILFSAEIEYRLCSSLGIGGSCYFGAGYLGVKNGKWTDDHYFTQHDYDSNGNDQVQEFYEKIELPVSYKRFDFTPLTAQVNFIYYFGKPEL